MDQFHNKLKSLRTNRKITVAAMVKYLNIQRETYYDYERGDTFPSVKKLIKIAEYFNVSIDYLLDHNVSDNSITPEHLDIANTIIENNIKLEDIKAILEAIRKIITH